MPTGAHLQRLTRDDYALVHRLRASGLTQTKIAQIVGTSQNNVSRILRGLYRGVWPDGARSAPKNTPPESQS